MPRDRIDPTSDKTIVEQCREALAGRLSSSAGGAGAMQQGIADGAAGEGGHGDTHGRWRTRSQAGIRKTFGSASSIAKPTIKKPIAGFISRDAEVIPIYIQKNANISNTSPITAMIITIALLSASFS
jgi:hypothetical protein